MNTDDLIAALGRDAAPVAPHAAERRLGSAMLAGFALAVVLVLSMMGVRPDLAAAPAVLWKGLFVVLMLGASTVFLLRAGRPALGLEAAAAPALVLLSASAVAAVFLTGLAPAGARLAALAPTGFPPCLVSVPLAALPAAVLVGLAVRRLGPTRLAHAGAAVGAAAGTVGALAYGLHCPIDSPAYVLAWYPTAVALCAAAGALAGPRLLRW